VKWAQVARQEALRNPDAAKTMRGWAVDNISPRFVAVGIGVSGDWKAAAVEYDQILPNSIGVMQRVLKEGTKSTIAGLLAIIAGATTVEAEGATVYAMSGRVPQAIELLEHSRRNTGRARLEAARSGAPLLTALQQEEKLLATGATIVQVVTSLVGAFALVSVRRRGKTQRFMAYNPDPGGYELMSRIVDSRAEHFLRDGLAPTYQRPRKAHGQGAERKFKDYVARASRDAEVLIGSTMRTALARASVTPQDDVLVVLPANLALLPISLSRATDAAVPLGMQFRLRYADSFAAALNAATVAKAPREQMLATLQPDPAFANLDYLGFERACVSSCFPGRVKLVQGTPSTTLMDLDGASHWHIASHASWDFKDPEKSGLAIAAKTTVVVADVQSLKLAAPPRLAFLSACETGLIDIDRRLDEFNGLLSALLASGAGGAIGSLWPVSDAATALLAARFYDEHVTGRRPPSEALQTAQRWLRDSTAGILGDFVTARVAGGRISMDDAGQISGFLIEKRADELIFRDPYYWAGFQLYGA